MYPRIPPIDWVEDIGEDGQDICVDRLGRYKRPFDLSILLVGHIVLLPLWLVLWVLIPVIIWFWDRGPIFYSQTRVGKRGRLFEVIKFRTMVKDAEVETGPVWSSEDDSRITLVGRALRRFRLDEMPQVINILKGEMSLVGPRPERPELEHIFNRDIPGFRARLMVRPGVAGLAQVRGHYSTRPRNKLRYDRLYTKNLSPVLDTKLIFMSLVISLRGYPPRDVR